MRPSEVRACRRRRFSLPVSAMQIARTPVKELGSLDSVNFPARSFKKMCRFPEPSIMAASGLPSPLRSAQTNWRMPETPAKGYSTTNVPSPLFLNTDGSPAFLPSTISRSPSASRSIAQAPVYAASVTDLESFVTAVTSVKLASLSCRKSRMPPSPASTRSVLKS